MKILHRRIGQQFPPLVIAEIGINHGGDVNVAKQMVLSAFRSGCEMVKHQTHFVDDEMTPEAKLVYPPNASSSIWDVIEQSALTKDEEIELKHYTESLGMIYISTPFSRKAADFLAEIGIPAFKIGSGEVSHLPLLKHVATFGRPVIMSTGMHSIDDVRPSVSVLEGLGIEYALLQCTNRYPTPPEDISLRGILELKECFPSAQVGYSDHSIGPSMALAAIALGATIIERHFTDTRYRSGPDISCSMDPAELRYLIDRGYEIHTALNRPKGRTVGEAAVYTFARSSVVADRDLPRGHIIGEEDIWARRPGTGEISVTDYYKLIGKRTNRALLKNQLIKWSDIE